MKIGILTLPLHTNYGGILQAYALQTILQRMGHDVVVYQTDYYGYRPLPFKQYLLLVIKRIIYKLFVDFKTPVFLERKKKKEMLARKHNIDGFIHQYICSCHVKNLATMPHSGVDAIIVGSDQIWRPEYVKKMWNTSVSDAFLKFSSTWHIKRIAYAASFGVDYWEYDQNETEECRQMAQRFDAVSVREQSGISLCSVYLGVKAVQTLDPTLLLEVDDYLSIVGRKRTEKPNGLFAYILDSTSDKMELIDRIAEERKLRKRSVIINGNDQKAQVREKHIPSIEEWLVDMASAEFVMTDSFHGCIFSIIFNKPFVAVGNVERGMSRFQSLFKSLGLESHLLVSVNDYSSSCSYQISDETKKKYQLLKQFSMNYLVNSLKEN